jgi:hypothetical protein
MDVIKANEAFAAQACAVSKELDLHAAKVNRQRLEHLAGPPGGRNGCGHHHRSAARVAAHPGLLRAGDEAHRRRPGDRRHLRTLLICVSYETVCHRLSTMQRPDARGIPLFFVRVDRAGNIFKRQSATDFHFSRTGGTRPLWNVYEAFAQPDKILTQVARMPDGRTYLKIACCISRRRGGYGTPARTYTVALGCYLQNAHSLVYASGIDLNDPAAATPIGAGCKVCDRDNCTQRAFPALGRELQVDEHIRHVAPYVNAQPLQRQRR